MVSTVPNIRDDARLSLSEAARIMEIDRKTLYKYHKSGKLNVFYRRLNNRPYVLGKDLLKVWYATY